MPSDDSKRGKDHHLGLRFWIEMDGMEIAGFSDCSGLSVEREVMEYAEGGWNLYTHKLPGRFKYGNITLKRGLDTTLDLFSWYQDSIQAEPTAKRIRKNISIIVYGPKSGDVVYRWNLQEAFPVKWIGPELKTDAGAVAIESLEIAHNGLRREETRYES